MNCKKLLIIFSLLILLILAGCDGNHGSVTGSTIFVKTEEEFLNAFSKAQLYDTIIVNDSFTVAGNEPLFTQANVAINQDAVLAVQEGQQLYIYGMLENNGEIVVNGSLVLKDRPDNMPYNGEKIESIINPIGTGLYTIEGGELAVYSVLYTSADIEKLFVVDSPFDTIYSTPGEMTFTIDEDVTIPKGHKIWLNKYVTLKVAKGVTLTNLGTIITGNEPIIEGTVSGNTLVLGESD